jgi:parallel beta-helix repeat protein
MQHRLGRFIISILVFGLALNSPAGVTEVTAFGAKGDGKTNDTPAFARALATGKDIYIPAGMYLVDEIKIPEGTFFHGSGYSSRIILAKGIGTISVGNHCKISDLNFTGQEKYDGKAGGSQNKALISIQNSSDVIVDNVRIENYQNTGLYMEHAADVKVLNSHFEKLNWGILIVFSNRILVSGNEVIDALSHGIQFWGQWKWELKDCADLIFSNNYVKNGGGGAIWGSGGKRVVMANNVIDGATDVGLDLEWCEDSTITGNTVRNCENGGISLFFSSQRISITGNTVINDRPISDPKATWWVRSGIWLTYPNRETYKNDFGHRDVTIAGNTISCTEGERRAIWIGSESENITIANNTLRGGEVWMGGKHKVNPMQLIKLKPNIWLHNEKPSDKKPNRPQ